MRTGLLFQPRNQGAVEMVAHATDKLESLGHIVWSQSSWQLMASTQDLQGTDLLISLGGDGTLLRAVRIGAPYGIPCLGVNFGNLGFLTELEGPEFKADIEKFVSTGGWREERILLAWHHKRAGKELSSGLAVNDIVVARGSISRVINITVTIDDGTVVTYTADGIVVATPTGSTGYALALNGPVMHPEARTLAIVPISPFMTASNPLVTNSNSRIELTVATQHEVGLTVDGQTHLEMLDGDQLICTASALTAQFIRFRPQNYFFPGFADKMRWPIPTNILQSRRDLE